MAATRSTLEGLIGYGFRHLTVWELRGERNKALTTEWDLTAGWIYSFVTDVRVRYIGIASTVLRTRLDGYSYQINDSVGGFIREQLRQNVPVGIYGVERAGAPKMQLQAEESRLIDRFKPDWNVRP